LRVTLSSNSARATFDATTITIPAGQYYAQTGVSFDTAGTYTITATATGYPDGMASTTTTGLVIRIQDNFFSSATITIPAGTPVTWKNFGQVSHTTTSNTGVWDSGPLTPGSTYSYSFSTPGTFPYYCTIHGAAVMSGTVIVQ